MMGALMCFTRVGGRKTKASDLILITGREEGEGASLH